MTLLASDRMQQWQWWPSKGHKIIGRKLVELCFAFKLDQFIKLPSRPVFSIWFAKPREKVDILGCVRIQPHNWHWLWPAYDTLCMSRWLLLKGCMYLYFHEKGEQLCVQRGCGKMTSWEVNKPLLCLVTLSMYVQKYKKTKVKKKVSSKYRNTKMQLENGTNFALTMYKNTWVQKVKKKKIQKNRNTSRLVTMESKCISDGLGKLSQKTKVAFTKSRSRGKCICK